MRVALSKGEENVLRLSRISRDRVDDGNSQAAAIVSQEGEAGWLTIHGNDTALILHQFGQMCCFATGRGTGIEYQLARLRIQDWGDELRGFVFHIEVSVLKSWERRHGAHFLQRHSNRTDERRICGDPFLMAAVEKLLSRHPQTIHPQCETGNFAGSAASGFGLGTSQSLDPPLT